MQGFADGRELIRTHHLLHGLEQLPFLLANVLGQGFHKGGQFLPIQAPVGSPSEHLAQRLVFAAQLLNDSIHFAEFLSGREDFLFFGGKMNAHLVIKNLVNFILPRGKINLARLQRPVKAYT